MRITPLDVRKQEFRKVVRGLDADEVYAFLTTVADEYEACLSDNKQLREKVIDLDEKVSEYRNMETTLRDTLLTAERVMAEARQNARKEAELILRDATMKANGQTAHIAAEVEALKNQLRDLRGQRDAFLARLQSLAESQVGLVESFRRDFQNEDAERSAHRVASFGQKPAETDPVAPEGPAEVESPQTPAVDGPAESSALPPVEPSSPSSAAGSSDEWRDYDVGSAAMSSPPETPERVLPAEANHSSEVATMTAPPDLPAVETNGHLGGQELSAVASPEERVPESVYAYDVAEVEVAIPAPAPDTSVVVDQVEVTESTPAPPVETKIDSLPDGGGDPSVEDPVDRIAQMMAEASAYEDMSEEFTRAEAASGQESEAVATSVSSAETEAQSSGEESSRWSLSRFTKGLANF